MINQKAKCVVCGEEFIYIDVKNPPQTCGTRVCDTNLKYIKAHKSPLTGKYPDPKEIKKWE